MATKIFYVEDEVFLAKIIKESLESRGYEVCLVTDGAKALAAYEQYAADICVLDVMLPNVDGFEIGQAIREQTPKTPIIYLTAKDQTQDVLAGFKAGGNDYIKKPCSIEELLVRIENLLSLTHQKAAKPYTKEAIQLGAFTFSPLKSQLQYKEKEAISLSHKEAELLKFFAQHINQVSDRRLLLNTVWGDDSFFNSRNLDVYIAKLRNYFKVDEQVKIITLRGVGYRFLVENQ
ncbi:MAG: response regulator transcription factor [Aureispira sp.]|nr:response regulator transcription factor [Aureispira sp.]